MNLGVNIDHIATLREARKINEPEPLEAIYVLKNAGVSQITAHLREDRRHMNDFDIERIIQNAPIPTNIESSTNKEILDFLIKLKPNSITLVPENRQEVTTEGGLLLTDRLRDIISKIKDSDIKVSLFINPSKDDITRAKDFGADSIELHTGAFANLFLILNSNLNRTPNKLDIINAKEKYKDELKRLSDSAKFAKSLELGVYAGHGLNYQNVSEILKIKEITELNIGHSIISRAVFCGLFNAVKEMLSLIKG
ncbi:MAG: pyridoxine 5'-phosphate synthase [Helicobacteraceae bacterium]|nr:pyridoxine 5'-phosphate synthase [Helicobacteraceae bacterium]